MLTKLRSTKIWMQRWLDPTRIALVAASLVALPACTSVKVKLGMRVYLAQTPVASMEARLPKGPGMAPGQKSPLVVTVTEPDGTVLLTEGQGGGKVMWKDLTVTARVVTVNEKGVVSLSKDPRVSDGKVGHVSIAAPSHPDVKAAELDIPFRYDVSFAANFAGSKGSDGMNGTDGMDGASGSMGSTDPNNPSAGGDGGNGTDGGNGGDGGSGGDAPPVEVRMALQAPTQSTLPSGSHPLLQVSVTAAGHQKLFLVDPQGGSLTVKADGGDGGSGGRGGRGGRGGSGGMGTPSGSNGRDGMDGRNGSDGLEGRGGLITVTYDPQAKPYLSALHVSSRNGPKPVFREGAVAALW